METGWSALLLLPLNLTFYKFYDIIFIESKRVMKVF